MKKEYIFLILIFILFYMFYLVLSYKYNEYKTDSSIKQLSAMTQELEKKIDIAQ